MLAVTTVAMAATQTQRTCNVQHGSRVGVDAAALGLLNAEMGAKRYDPCLRSVVRGGHTVQQPRTLSAAVGGP